MQTGDQFHILTYGVLFIASNLYNSFLLKHSKSTGYDEQPAKQTDWTTGASPAAVRSTSAAARLGPAAARARSGSPPLEQVATDALGSRAGRVGLCDCRRRHLCES